MFLGYSDESKAYRVWNRVTKRESITRNVLFHENTTSLLSTAPTTMSIPLLLSPVETLTIDAPPAQATSIAVPQDTNAQASTTTDTAIATTDPTLDADSQVLPRPSSTPAIANTSRPQRNHKPLIYYGEWANLAIAPPIEPKTYKEAITCDEHHHWQQAMDEEFNSQTKNNTWSLIELPPHRNVVQCKWTYKLKFNANGSITRYKARLVAKGFSQRHGIDYFETYSPMVCMDSICVILSIVAVDNLELRQFDIATAFLNGTL
jgi:hypothetical protein